MSRNIGALIAAIKEEAQQVTEARAQEATETEEELQGILADSIQLTLKEIKEGANSEEFKDLTVINFLIQADDAGYSPEVIRGFVQDLKTIRKSRPKKSS